MDLRDIFFGLIWLFIGNLAFYFLYPVFGAFLTGMSTATVGEFGLTDTITALGWGGYLITWAFVGLGIPAWMIIGGANKDQTLKTNANSKMGVRKEIQIIR